MIHRTMLSPPSTFQPSNSMGRNVVRMIREPTAELIEEFGKLLTLDGRTLCDTRPSILLHSCTQPVCQVQIATPIDAPGLVIGGIIFVHLSESPLSYVAALYVRRDFRGRRIGRTLFEELQRSFARAPRIAFCDFVRPEKARLRPSLFPVEGRYSIRRVVGFAVNIALAGGEIIAAHGKVEEGDSLPEVRNFPSSFDMDKIVEFDASVAGRNRSSALKEVRQMDGFAGVVAQDHSKRVVGYAMSLPGVRHREITIGPLYAVNLVTAICMLRDLCCSAGDDKIICVHVPHMGHRMLRFLQDKALCDVDKQFDRFYTHNVNVPADDLSKIFAISAKILLPDC